MKKAQWNTSDHPARLWTKEDDGSVTCHLSPRNCHMKEGQKGFCGVRQNSNGSLVTLNYGRATHVTEESIETEAVFHYLPGAPILSLGNIGCMLNCDFCQNWSTSQAKFVKQKDVHQYSPQDVVDMAKERGIPVLSWTYNDPVVWQEFVLDTGKLAKENGLLNLYKSAFFISLEGAAELCEVVDIFSLSIKTLNEKMYRKMSKGWLQPVLDAAKYVYDQGKHVELSMLMITDANDGEKDARELAEWVLTHMSPDVPVHFVRFHPDYKYTHVGRTPVDRLVRAREVAKEMGIKYCYLGNVYGNDGTNTYCPGCDQLLVERYGLNTWIRGLTHKGDCDKCGMEHAFTLAQAPIVPDSRRLQKEAVEHFDTERAFNWRGDINACHLELGNETDSRQVLYYWRTMENGSRIGPYKTYTDAGQSYRFILSKSREDETGLLLNHKNSLDVKIFEVLDRAHYPTEDIDAKVPDTAMTV